MFLPQLGFSLPVLSEASIDQTPGVFMRILHVANFNTHKYGTDLYSTDRKISAGLVRNGHFVYDFSYRDVCRNESFFRTTKLGTGSVNQKLLKACSQINPHLLLLGHSELITSETLEKVRKSHPSIKIGLWYVDALFHREKTEHLFNRLQFIDMVFATTSGSYLREYSRGTTSAVFIPNMVDPAVESYTAFRNTTCDYDFIFCGRDSNDPERRTFMEKLQLETGKTMRSAFFGCLGNRPVTGHDYLALLSRSRMALNISRRNDVRLYSSDRIAQLTGNGLLTFCPRIPAMELLYTEKELVYFSTPEELLARIQYFHSHPDEAEKRAEKGWHRAHRSFNTTRVTAYMIERLFDQPLSSDYEWQDEFYTSS